MDVNPYQPPREPDPLQKKQPVKQAIGLATILILTPVAVLIAAGGSCAAAIAIVDSAGGDYNSAITAGLIVFVAPPVLVLIAMIWWAVRAARQSKN